MLLAGLSSNVRAFVKPLTQQDPVDREGIGNICMFIVFLLHGICRHVTRDPWKARCCMCVGERFE